LFAGRIVDPNGILSLLPLGQVEGLVQPKNIDLETSEDSVGVESTSLHSVGDESKLVESVGVESTSPSADVGARSGVDLCNEHGHQIVNPGVISFPCPGHDTANLKNYKAELEAARNNRLLDLQQNKN
jgi:hypothetical protein